MKKKIGEVFTVDREVSSGTGYSYYVTGITGGLALLDTNLQSGNIIGGKAKQTFSFVCLTEGKASFQLAKFRSFDVSEVLYENVIPVEIEGGNDTNSIPGGWTDLHKPSSEEIKIFNEAFEGFVGVSYNPILVRSQVVKGVNYVYLTEATGVYPGAKMYKAQVSIYKPIDGKAMITDIVRILGNE